MLVAMLLMASAVITTAAAAAAEAEADRPTAVRTKRQLPPIEEGNQVIDDIFQIPIGTLNAVGSLIKSTRPLVRRTRQRIQQYYGNGQTASSQYQQQRPQYAYNQNGNNRPYYNNGNRRGRDEPPAEGRRGGRRANADYY